MILLAKLEYWVPLLHTLRTYRVEWLRNDLAAGVSVAAIQIPTAIAYAELAGFGPEVGLYASILPLVAYALFGSSRQLIVGPDAATCAIVAAVLVPLAALRPMATEGRARAPRTPGAAKGGSDSAKKSATGAGAVRKGGGERASGADPRNQYANRSALVGVVGTDGKVVDREVKVGVTNRVSAQILSGLEPGENVVIGTSAPVAAAAKAPATSSLTPTAAKGGGRK